MKAIFPCKGVVVLTKTGVTSIHNYYKSTLINSKLFSLYNQSNFPTQVGNLNYLPKKSNIVLDNAHLLTLKQLQQVLNQSLEKNTEANNEIESETVKDDENTPLDDNFVMNHPFFKTLTQLD